MSPEGDDALNAKFRIGTHPPKKRGFPTAWWMQQFSLFRVHFEEIPAKGHYFPQFLSLID
ncbi:MAG: hypothetical protein E6230_28770 [Paenibacillus dendritiformis]|uniref:hypothetical protein n=1 Tax=uncultured Paenibacillus sp. TaxID=227322 RepID=UPI0025E63A86|nr:hypothetical protein [uncultured Paenibacillus sp.]MDU5146145.1 hypothetical protein [Paenibacillus dendritiformis]